MSTLFVIGDVHGCIYTLESLVKKLPRDAGLIFVGDLVDKGKHSANVIEFVKGNNHPCVYGNHEYLLFNYLRDAIYRDKRDSNWATKDGWGGAKTIENYKACPHLVDEHIAWVEKLPRYIQKDRYFITHGFGLPYYMRKDHPSSKRPLLSNRIDETDETFINDWEVGYEEYEVINIFGHCPFKEVLRGGNYYGIDTSCVYGGKLTALELGTENIVQVQLDKRDI
jgi:serine/threonine protein phosphatase 1